MFKIIMHKTLLLMFSTRYTLQLKMQLHQLQKSIQLILLNKFIPPSFYIYYYQMSKLDEELIGSLHKSVQQIINLFKLIKANPPDLRATNVLDYAKLIEDLLLSLHNTLPKLCVPIHLFRKMEKDSMQINQLAENYMREHRKSLIEMRVLEDKLRQAEEREKILIQEKKEIWRKNQHYRKKAQMIKKSGEESVKNLLDVGNNNMKLRRQSLPHLDKKQKIGLLYLMGPNPNSDRLVNHLMNKR